MASAANVPVLKEGVLLKRQRGLTHFDWRGLKFQQRFCRLTQQYLLYLEKRKDTKAKGKFPVSQIEIVEKVPVETFGKDFCLQIGNEQEVMYLVAKSENDREEWIEALTIAARDISKNLMLPHYHTGAYGLVHHQKWSCCHSVQRNARGCYRANSSHFSLEPRMYRSFYRQSSQDSERFLRDQTRVSLPPDFYGPQYDESHPIVQSCPQQMLDNFDTKDDFFAGQSQYSFDTTDSGYKDSHFSISRRTLSDTSIHSGSKFKVHSPTPHPKHNSRKASRDSVLSGVSDTINSDTSPLVHAFNEGDYTALQGHLEKEVDPNEAISDGRSLLHLASESGRMDVVQLLLRYSARVDSTDKLGETPLMTATRHGHLQVMLCLIDSNADVDKQSHSGRTALHEAAECGCNDAVEALLERGANYQLRTHSQKIPYDLAYEQKHKEVMYTLEQYMPQTHIPYSLGAVYSGHHSEPVSSLGFAGADTLFSGSQDGTVASVSTLKPDSKVMSMTLGSGVGSVAVWKSRYLAIGAQDVQLRDMKNWEWKFKLPEPMNDDTGDVKGDKAGKLVSFTPEGTLITADTTRSKVHVWSNVSTIGECAEGSVFPGGEITIEEEQSSCICSMSVSPNPKQPWLGVGVKGQKKVYLYDYTTQQPRGIIEFSKGTAMADDIYAPCDNIHTAFTNDGMKVAVAYGGNLKLFDVDSTEQVYEYSQHTEGISITGVCYSPTGKHIAATLSDGDVAIMDGQQLTPKPLFNLSHPQEVMGKLVSGTSLAYSQDSSKLAIGYENGAVQLWEVPKFAKPQRKPKLLDSEEIFEFGVEGGRYESTDDGYAIEADKDTITEGTASISHGALPVRPFGSFKFLDDVCPVSAIISVCHRNRGAKSLLKPIAVTLDHCVDYETFAEYNSNLAFFKADHTKYVVNRDGEKVYTFQKIEDCEVEFDGKCATVHTKHFCYLCVGTFHRADTNKARFAIHEAKPITCHGKVLPLDYCICYDLPSCHKNVKVQYPESAFELSTRVFKFSQQQGDDPSIQVKFTERFNEGWMILCKSSTRVCRSSVNFWDETPAGLVAMCEDGRYPPRIKLKVHSDRARKDVLSTVAFDGSVEVQGKERASFTVRLTCPLQVSELDLEDLTVTADPTASAEHCMDAALKALQSGYEALAQNKNVDPLELAVKFYSRRVVNDHNFMTKVTDSEGKHKLYRMVEILQYITNAIRDDPKCFPIVCKILEENAPEVALKIRNEYQSYIKQLRRESSLLSTTSAASTKSPLDQTDSDIDTSLVGAEANHLPHTLSAQQSLSSDSFARVFSSTPSDAAYPQQLQLTDKDVTPVNESEQ